MVDRQSVRGIQRKTLNPHQQQLARTLRHEDCTMRHIIKHLATQLYCWSLAQGHRARHPEKPADRRGSRPVQMGPARRQNHVAANEVARFEHIGHHVTGDRRKRGSAGAGYGKGHVLWITPRARPSFRCCLTSRKPKL